MFDQYGEFYTEKKVSKKLLSQLIVEDGNNAKIDYLVPYKSLNQQQQKNKASDSTVCMGLIFF